jgi:hypothetical protein
LRPDAAQLKVKALDANGYLVRTFQMSESLPLLPNTLYYVIEK